MLLRGVDLLGIPTMDSDKSVAVEIHVAEDLAAGSNYVKGGKTPSPSPHQGPPQPERFVGLKSHVNHPQQLL